MSALNYRIGYGEDIHKLVEGRPLILGGVNIPFAKGLLGHSDADVVFHALSDAILGALALGDIGKHFPDNAAWTEGMDSGKIVSKVGEMMKQKGYGVGNIDLSIACEKPKLAPHIDEMRKNIASLLEVSEEQVSVKAMTNEGMDAVGEGKAIRATCVVLLKKEN